MSTAGITNLNLQMPSQARNIQRRSLLVGVVFAVISVILAFVQTDKFFHAYLAAYMLWLGASLGCMAFLMIQHLTGGAWGIVIRRPLEAGMRTLPLMIVLFLPIIAGMKHLYFWTNPANVAANEHLKELTHSYLTTSGFILRAAVYFVIWGALAFLLDRYSVRQDSPPVRNMSPLFRTISAPGLVLYSFTISFASIDWVMSLTAPWISTIYGMIFIVGECLTGLCVVIIVEAILRGYEPLATALKAKEVHDHGKLVLTFVMLWAYFSFSQLLITWAGNLPEEIVWYTRRLYKGWEYIGLALAAFHFVLPFLLLLSRPFKRKTTTMMWVAGWLIVMRYLDLYWFVEPNFGEHFFVTTADIVLPVAIGGLWLWYFFRNLGQRPLLPPYSLHAQELLKSPND
jgi:hypothetical protein